MIRLIVHAGALKTASTFLRFRFFPNLDDCLYLGKNEDGELIPEEINTLYKKIFPAFFQKTTPIGFRAQNSALLLPALAKQIIHELKKSGKNNVVISNETLFDFADYNAEANQLLLHRLHAQLKTEYDGEVELKVFMTIRNQNDFLKSFYTYFYQRFYRQFPSFRDFLSYGLANPMQTVFGQLHYDALLRDLESLFGADNVRFFVYEQMQEDSKKYLQDILDFMGSKANLDQIDYQQKVNVNSNEAGHGIKRSEYKGLSILGRLTDLIEKVYQVQQHRLKSLKNIPLIYGLWNRLLSVRRNSKTIVIKGRIKQIPDDLLPGLQSLYSKSNEALAERLGIDLAKYGYWTSSK